MDNPSRIFWFSGTGNSLYAAKRLSAKPGICLLLRWWTARLPVQSAARVRVGFVFHLYGNLPRAVRAFVNKIDIRPGTYLFAIVTMGGPTGICCRTDKALRKRDRI